MMLVFVFFLESPILVSWMWYLLYYLRMIFFFSVLHFVSSKDWFVSVCFRFYLTGSRHPLDAVTHWMIGDFEYVGRWGLLTLCFTTGWSGWSQGNLQWCSLWRHQIEGGSNAALTYLPVHEPWSEAMCLPERRDALFLPQNCDLLFKSDISKASSTQRKERFPIHTTVSHRPAEALGRLAEVLPRSVSW